MGCLQSCFGGGTEQDKPPLEPKENPSNGTAKQSKEKAEAVAENPEEVESAKDLMVPLKEDPAIQSGEVDKSAVEGLKMSMAASSASGNSKASKASKQIKKSKKKKRTKKKKAKAKGHSHGKAKESKAAKLPKELDPYSAQESYNTSINVSNTVLMKAISGAKAATKPSSNDLLKQNVLVAKASSSKASTKKAVTTSIGGKKSNASKNAIKLKQSKKGNKKK